MNKYLPILILFILADVVSDNTIMQVFGGQSTGLSMALSGAFLILQIASSPIQAGFSDFYCRKKSLILALVFTFFAIVILFLGELQASCPLVLLIIVLFLKGAFGNTVPLAWAALADSQEKNLRLSLALSTTGYAIGYIVIAILKIYPIKGVVNQEWLTSDIIPSLLLAISVFLCIKCFRDIRDRKHHSSNKNKLMQGVVVARSEFISLAKDMGRKSTFFGALAYVLWATSQYSVLILLADFQSANALTVIWMMSGYFFGVIALSFCKKIRDQTIIRVAFFITLVSFLLYFVLNYFFSNGLVPLTICGFFYTFSNAFISSSILSLFSKERAPHEQGRGFGLISSADTLGFLVASIAVLIYIHMDDPTKSNVLELWRPIFFSSIVFLFSWIPYVKYEKTRKDMTTQSV